MYKFTILEVSGNQAKIEFENQAGLFYTRFVNIPKSSHYDPNDLNSLIEDKDFAEILNGIQLGLKAKENLGVTEFLPKAPDPAPTIPIQNDSEES